jgi:hypothetical protein
MTKDSEPNGSKHSLAYIIVSHGKGDSFYVVILVTGKYNQFFVTEKIIVKPYGCQPACSDPYVDINYDACINDT